MRRFWLLWILGASAVLVAVLAATAVLVPRACPAIGYVYTGPIELRSGTTAVQVSACFGADCEPAPVEPVESGRWLVPQEAPFLAVDADSAYVGQPRQVRVVVTDPTGGTTDAVLAIPTRPRAGKVGGPQCPGPVEYLPVELP